MDLQLTADQLQFRQLARRFVDREVVPFRRDWDRVEAVDRGLLAKLGSAGFLGLTIGEEYGGSGGDYLSYALVTEELGRADSAVRGLVSVSLGLVGKTIAAHGSEEQRRRWLPRITSGASLGCFALTEPDTGSDAASLQTRAVRDGDDYLLTGSKMFITNGVWADLALVFARTGGAGPSGISAFLVPTGSPGFEAVEIKGKLGLRGQATAQLYLSEVRVPAAARLGPEGRGFGIAMAALDRGRMSVAAGCVGIVQGCLDAAVAYARERHQFGRPIASFQLVQDMIAEMAVDADAGRLLVWRVVDLIERGESFGVAASKAKYFASEAAVRAANNAIQVFGGYGYVDEYPVAKFLRDARVMTLYEGTSQVQKLLIGRAVTGISAFV
jgi:alkylation response protein AidB-like acyl-CoA dehydrogenase